MVSAVPYPRASWPLLPNLVIPPDPERVFSIVPPLLLAKITPSAVPKSMLSWLAAVADPMVPPFMIKPPLLTVSVTGPLEPAVIVCPLSARA